MKKVKSDKNKLEKINRQDIRYKNSEERHSIYFADYYKEYSEKQIRELLKQHFGIKEKAPYSIKELKYDYKDGRKEGYYRYFRVVCDNSYYHKIVESFRFFGMVQFKQGVA